MFVKGNHVKFMSFVLLAVGEEAKIPARLPFFAQSIIKLTNRFHVAVHLFSNRSQKTSKCGKNKKMAHKTIAECVTDVLTTFWRLL